MFTTLITACNAITMFKEGIHTMKNYGERRNCSLYIMYPAHVRILSLDVGITTETPEMEAEVGIYKKVSKRRKYPKCKPKWECIRK